MGTVEAMILAGTLVRQAIAVARTARWDHRGTVQFPPIMRRLRHTAGVPQRLPTMVVEAGLRLLRIMGEADILAAVIPAVAPLADTRVEVAGATLAVAGSHR